MTSKPSPLASAWAFPVAFDKGDKVTDKVRDKVGLHSAHSPSPADYLCIRRDSCYLMSDASASGAMRAAASPRRK